MKKNIKKAISSILILCVCLGMCACGGSSDSIHLAHFMNGFEWGQSQAQVEKNMADHDGSYTVCGINVSAPYVNYSEGGLNRIRYTMSQESSSKESQDVFDQLTPEYNEIKKKITQILGDPDKESELYSLSACWYVGDDIVTLSLSCDKKTTNYMGYYIVRYVYAIELLLEHT